MLPSNGKLSCFIILFTSTVLCVDLDDLKKEYVGNIMNCAKEYPVTEAEILKLKNKEVPDSHNAKCLLACSYKKAGMMDEHGMLSVEGLNAISQKYLSDDPAQVKKAEDFTNTCRSVNDETVSDGAQGCDRAALIFKCSVEKAPEFELAS